MNKKTNGHMPTVIIMNGKPYQLTELKRKNFNDTCSKCDLRQECGVSDDFYYLRILCKSDDRDDGWYFEEDWSIYDKRICDFVSPELTDKLLDE